MIRAIFFDLDGTLIDRAVLWRRCLSRFVVEHGGLAIRDEARLGEGLAVTFADWPRMARILERSVPGLGMTCDQIGRALREQMLQSAEPDPAVNDLLDDLARHYTTAIATNGSARLQRAKIAGAGLAGRTGSVFISGEMGVRKPDPAFFARVLAWARVKPGDALIVGDHPYEDIYGGQRAGLLTCQVGGRPVDGLPEPDFRIAGVADLLGVLG